MASKETDIIEIEPINYFGYGLESDPKILQSIIGHRTKFELGMFAVGRLLAVQEIKHVPDIPVEALGGISVKQALSNTWNSQGVELFSSYTMINSSNIRDVVRGTLFEISAEDKQTLVDWNFAYPDYGEGSWTVLDDSIRLKDGRTATTLIINPEKEIDRIVDGIKHPTFLNGIRNTILVIQEFRKQRHSQLEMF